MATLITAAPRSLLRDTGGVIRGGLCILQTAGLGWTWPSPLFDKLKWLEAAGFATLDVHYLKAGHAILSGVKV